MGIKNGDIVGSFTIDAKMYHTSIVLQRMKGTEILHQMLRMPLAGILALKKTESWFIPIAFVKNRFRKGAMPSRKRFYRETQLPHDSGQTFEKSY